MNEKLRPLPKRREALMALAAATAFPVLSGRACALETSTKTLAYCVGITTGGGLGKKRERGELDLMKLPAYVRDELGMWLIDVNSRWTDPYDANELERARNLAESEDCYFSNLKVNRSVGDLYSHDRQERNEALAEGRRMIDLAEILGTRWIRFTVPKANAANPTSHTELAGYAEQKGIGLLVENSGWLKDRAGAIPKIVEAIGRNVSPCPDTGNWASNEIRVEGLRQSFVGAASCDFKVFELDANRQHQPYDLHECFMIGWDAGFRGPWVIELMTEGTESFARDTIFIREMLEQWIAASK